MIINPFAFGGGGYATLAITGTFAAATVGAAYSSSLPITGGNGSCTLTGGTGVVSGSLDSGFSLSVTGTTGAQYLTLSCASPATADTMSFTASVGSGDGQTATSAQSIVVSASITYATWDPANKASSIALSGGNLIATNSGTGGMVFSNKKIAVKTYFELNLNSGGYAGVNSGGGVSDITVSSTLSNMALTNLTISCWLSTLDIYQNSAVIASLHGSISLATLGICVDPSTRKIWVGDASTGIYAGGGNPAAGTGETGTIGGSSDIYAAGCPYTATTFQKLIADPSGFIGSAPSGFVAGF